MAHDTALLARIEALEHTVHAIVGHFGRVPELATRCPGPEVTPPQWDITLPRRDDGLAWTIYQVLKVARDAGARRPTATDVLQAFEQRRPPAVRMVTSQGLEFFATDGSIRSAGVEQIRGRINRMTRKPCASERKPYASQR